MKYPLFDVGNVRCIELGWFEAYLLYVPLLGLVSSLPTDEDSDRAAEECQESEHDDDDPSQGRNDYEEKIAVAPTGTVLAVPQEPHRVVQTTLTYVHLRKYRSRSALIQFQCMATPNSYYRAFVVFWFFSAQICKPWCMCTQYFYCHFMPSVG